MLRVSLYQLSMSSVDPDVIGLAPDSFERHLPGLLAEALSDAELPELQTSTKGAPTRCPLSMVAMMLLQFRYDLSERELLERCQRDLGFRCALGLEGQQKPPSARTYQRFREHLFSVKGDDYLLRLSLQLAVQGGFLDDVAVQAVDSTNTDCRGAIIDTFNLVAAGIRQVLRSVAHCLGVRPEALAREWTLSQYMARSVKGTVNIDWNDRSQRNAFLTQEIRDADRVAAKVGELRTQIGMPQEVEQAVELLLQVARQDVEELDDGTFQVAKGTAPGRVISISDPEARHGRKSAAKKIHGFKTHVTGTIASQFVTGILITDASVHDGQPTPDLIAQTQANGVKPMSVVGDMAYGAGANIHQLAKLGVDMRTKAGQPTSGSAISKRAFDIDVDRLKVTCPAGKSTETFSMVQVEKEQPRAPSFRFAKEDCQACELKRSCCADTANGGFRKIRLNPFERELQENRAFAETPEGAKLLRSRAAVERLISHLIRMGMRNARFFSMARVQIQAFMVGAAYNLQRLITLKVAAARAAP